MLLLYKSGLGTCIAQTGLARHPVGPGRGEGNLSSPPASTEAESPSHSISCILYPLREAGGSPVQDTGWLGLSASVLAGEGFPQPGPERPK